MFDLPDAVVALDADVVLLEVVVSHGDSPGQYLPEVLIAVTVGAAQVPLLSWEVFPDRSELVGFVLYRIQSLSVQSGCWSCFRG